MNKSHLYLSVVGFGFYLGLGFRVKTVFSSARSVIRSACFVSGVTESGSKVHCT